MSKGKVKDFLRVTREVVFQETLESDYLPEVISAVGDVITSEGASLVIGSVIGAAAPRINAIRLNYLEKRFEKNVANALIVMQRKINDLENNYSGLEIEIQEKFRGLYVEWLMDNLHSERQHEKVEAHVNGFINMMSSDVNDNVMLMFMDTLNQLTQLDIDVLKLYGINSDETGWDLLKRYGIETNQLAIIKGKLVRFGLLYSKQDDLRDDNIDAVVKYLFAIDAASKKSKPPTVKMKDVKKPKISNSFSITPLGRSFLLKISN